MNDGGWSGASDDNSLGVVAGYNLPPNLALTNWILGHDLDLRIEAWLGSHGSGSYAFDFPQPEVGLRVVGSGASLRFTWTRGTAGSFDDSDRISSGQIATIFRWSESDVWSVGLAIPLGMPVESTPTQR